MTSTLRSSLPIGQIKTPLRSPIRTILQISAIWLPNPLTVREGALDHIGPPVHSVPDPNSRGAQLIYQYPSSLRATNRKRRLSVVPLPGVIGLLGNDLSHSPLGTGGITRVPGNQMDVDMEDTLPRGRTHVHTYVVAFGIEFVIQCPLLVHQ